MYIIEVTSTNNGNISVKVTDTTSGLHTHCVYERHQFSDRAVAFAYGNEALSHYINNKAISCMMEPMREDDWLPQQPEQTVMDAEFEDEPTAMDQNDIIRAYKEGFFTYGHAMLRLMNRGVPHHQAVNMLRIKDAELE